MKREGRTMKHKLFALLAFLLMLTSIAINVRPIFASDVHDVAVTEVTPSMNQVCQGLLVKVNVTVANLGNVTEETFNVALYYDSTKIDEQPVENLTAEQTRTLSFSWNTSGVEPCKNYTLRANATIVLGDINETNNELFGGPVKVNIFGDINGDGYVNIMDAVPIGVAFGSNPDDVLHWNPQADLNQDEFINVKDIILLGQNFGAKHE